MKHDKCLITQLICLIGWARVCVAGDADLSVLADLQHSPFRLTDRTHHATCAPAADGGWLVNTTGTDPYVYTEGLLEAYRPDTSYVLAFEYQTPAKIGTLHLLYQSADGLQTIGSRITPTKTWRWHFVDLAKAGRKSPLPTQWFRFDFGSQPNKQFRIRNCRLIEKTHEFQLLSRRYKPFSLVSHGHHATCTESSDGSWIVQTTGFDPYVLTRGIAEACDPEQAYVIAFQYKAPKDFGRFQTLYETPGGLRHINLAIKPTESWRWHFVKLPQRGDVLGESIRWLRFDFGDHENRRFEIRDCRVIRSAEPFDPTHHQHVPFTLAERGHHARIDKLPGGGWHIHTTGNDPYVATHGLADAFDPNTPYIIAFEYQTPPEFGDIRFYYNTSKGMKNKNAGVKPSTEWAWHLHDFSKAGNGLGVAIKSFRIDFSDRPDLQFKIRNCRLIKATPKLRLRAILGEQADRVHRFGISLHDVQPQSSAVETLRNADSKSIAVTKSTYRHLDLDAETKRLADHHAVQPPVPLGPRLVAGEGEHPDNHTVVRILSRHQLCESQFLAFPPNVRGGVGVECGRLPDGSACIAAWPLRSSEVREIALFNRFGGSIGRVTLPDSITPPFVVSVGDFRPDRDGDEIAVTARYSDADDPRVHVISMDGTRLDSTSIPIQQPTKRREFALLSKQTGDGATQLVAQDLTDKRAYQIHPIKAVKPIIDFSRIARDVRLFDSVYDDRDFNLGGPEALVSTLLAWNEEAATKQINAGRMENIFWFDPQEVHGGSVATWAPVPDGQYVKNSKYNFLGPAWRWSPLVKSGDIEGKSYEQWVDGIRWEDSAFLGRGRHFKRLEDYDDIPTTWSATFTHRWHTKAAKAISSKRDPKTGLPVYLLLDRSNKPVGGGYFGKRLFDYGSQNFEQEALDKFYTYCQRAFYRRLAPLYRRNPEMTLAVEPNHENEIVSGKDSVGDYNPKSIEGFYHYLIALYGDLENVNRHVGSKFSRAFFDAPRGLLRGKWDRYDIDNPYFQAWVEYNRIQIYRRVGSSYREVLLAGFPPELIKCHQIPGSYVFGSIVGISEGDVRISPIDWLLTTGAGFGFSRYGTYYQRKHNIGQGAHSSGYDGMLVGEYASLNPNPQHALGQLRYLRDRGVSSLHVMWWPEHLDKGFNRAQHTALQQLATQYDVPKPGLAGGISQVRAYHGPNGSYDIASLGTGPRHTGLIKSLGKDGAFEGTVYAVPFHAHIDVQTVCHERQLVVTDSPQQLCKVHDIRQGSVVEVTFTIDSTRSDCELYLDLLHRGVKLNNQRVRLHDLATGQNVRVVYKLPLILDEIAMNVTANSPVKVRDLAVIRHQDQAVNLTKKIMEGKRHQGGVSFDVLPE